MQLSRWRRGRRRDSGGGGGWNLTGLGGWLRWLRTQKAAHPRDVAPRLVGEKCEQPQVPERPSGCVARSPGGGRRERSGGCVLLGPGSVLQDTADGGEASGTLTVVSGIEPTLGVMRFHL